MVLFFLKREEKKVWEEEKCWMTALNTDSGEIVWDEESRWDVTLYILIICGSTDLSYPFCFENSCQRSEAMDIPDEGGTLMRKFVDHANRNHYQSMIVRIDVGGYGRFNNIDTIRYLSHQTSVVEGITYARSGKALTLCCFNSLPRP